ncbi:unnamed protein product [Echinostoma caproni]|uniref:U1-type domain-containing protein n=1 Tax=Echinostoma caproni TaxID=27848 RepID=A0A183BCB2_9TREM|nr:unnamed protein product [Echinostoma caproni]
MGKRFHCDYCDKSFPDNLVNRRAHLNGVQHQQARKLHFENFLGVCDYGIMCRYSHMTPEALRQLEDAAGKKTCFSYFVIENELSAKRAVLMNVADQIGALEALVQKRRREAIDLASGLYRLKVPYGYEESKLPPSLFFLQADKKAL